MRKSPSMPVYVVLFRGINVGGKNRIPMAELKQCLTELGFSEVVTYIASGNVLLRSEKSADRIRSLIEGALPERFPLDSDRVRVLVLTRSQLNGVIDRKPPGFGDQPDRYHSDAIFLMELEADAVLTEFNPREGVDRVWPGDGVIYSQRLSAERTKSRLNRIMGTPSYQAMTIRNWNTVLALKGLADQLEVDEESGCTTKGKGVPSR